MKKIICTVTNDLNYDQRMIRICTSLSKAGYKVLLIGRQVPASPPFVTRPFLQKRFKLFFQKGKLFYLEYNIRLFFFLLFSTFDIVCAVDLDSLVPGFFVSKIRGKVCVYDAHEYFTEVPEVVSRPLVKKTWEKIARFIIPRLSNCYTVGECLAAVFEKRYQTNFSVIRNVPFKNNLAADEKMKPAKSPFVILYQGVLNEGRGLEEAIEAMVSLNDVELWLAGDGDISLKLRDLVIKFRVGPKVKFLGRVAPEELSLLTTQAHLGLNLLKNKGLNYYYSLANKAFDYIQAHTPSLNMDFPEYRKINDEHGVFILLDSLDSKKIAETVQKIRGNESQYSSLVDNCKKASQIFTWEKEETKLLQIYHRL